MVGIVLTVFCFCNNLKAETSESDSVVLVVGDSLSAAYGIETQQGWVSLLAERIKSNSPAWRVVNGSVSGHTTLDGKNRIDYLIQTNQPNIVILELGANDGLRGYPIESIRRNLEILIDRAIDAGAFVILAGMQLPQNYGPRYLSDFKELYYELAEAHDLELIPFLLDGVAIDESKMQADAIHPNADGQPQIMENVWSVLSPYLTTVPLQDD